MASLRVRDEKTPVNYYENILVKTDSDVTHYSCVIYYLPVEDGEVQYMSLEETGDRSDLLSEAQWRGW